MTYLLNNSYGGYALTGPGQLRVIDSAGGGTVVLGSSDDINNAYTGGTTVLSGTLQVLYAQALPSTGILTVGEAGSIVLSSQVGTLFGSNAIEQVPLAGSMGMDLASSATVTDSSNSPDSVVASGVGMVPVASSPAAVPEPSTLALLERRLAGSARALSAKEDWLKIRSFPSPRWERGSWSWSLGSPHDAA